MIEVEAIVCVTLPLLATDMGYVVAFATGGNEVTLPGAIDVGGNEEVGTVNVVLVALLTL